MLSAFPFGIRLRWSKKRKNFLKNTQIFTNREADGATASRGLSVRPVQWSVGTRVPRVMPNCVGLDVLFNVISNVVFNVIRLVVRLASRRALCCLLITWWAVVRNARRRAGGCKVRSTSRRQVRMANGLATGKNAHREAFPSFLVNCLRPRFPMHIRSPICLQIFVRFPDLHIFVQLPSAIQQLFALFFDNQMRWSRWAIVNRTKDGFCTRQRIWRDFRSKIGSRWGSWRRRRRALGVLGALGMLLRRRQVVVRVVVVLEN